MKTFIKFLLLFTFFLFSLLPTMVAFIYMFAGKQAFLEFVTMISPERFWLFGIPFFIIAMAASVFSLMEMIALSSPNKPKRLSIDDPDLSRKLSKLYL